MRMLVEGKWTLLKRISGGHKFFWLVSDHSYGTVGVADDSGYTPDQTDDGVMLLDMNRPVFMSRDHNSIPLIREHDGTMSSSPCGAEEALWVASTFSMKVSTGQSFYTIRQE